MRDVALFASEHSRKLQWSGGLLLVLSLCILSSFFIDLMKAMALRPPTEGARDWLPVVAGVAISLLIPVAGACAGLPEKGKTAWLSSKATVGVLLLCLGGSIAIARYSKVLDHLQAKQLAAAEKAQKNRVEAATAAAQSPEAKARAEMLTAQARLLASSADALEQGSKRLTPKVREDAVAMAKLVTNLQAGAVAPPTAIPVTAQPAAISTVKVIESVVGPAFAEFLLAELIAFVAAIWGAAAFARVPAEEELLEEARHPGLYGVDFARLSDEALDGLDIVNGTWRGLPLGDPAQRGRGRQAVMWPTLALRGKSFRVFIGSPQALSHARWKAMPGNNDGGEDVAEHG